MKLPPLLRLPPLLSWGRLSHQGYTKLVRVLRIALPATAALVLAGVIAWPHFDPAQAPKRHAEAAPPEMNHSHFSGLDKRNRPYSITADKAVQKSTDSNDVDLTRPVAEITTEGGSWLAIKADQGQYREDPGVITLRGDVRLFHDQGYEVATSSAAIDLDNGLAWGDQPTKGQGPRGEIEGEGFRLVQDSDAIIFTGKSRLLLRPDQEEVPPGAPADMSGEPTENDGPVPETPPANTLPAPPQPQPDTQPDAKQSSQPPSPQPPPPTPPGSAP